MESLMEKRKVFIVGGDLNINLLSDVSRKVKFKNLIEDTGARQIVTNPTRFSYKNKGSLIDHIYTNLIENEISTETISFEVSDHIPTIALTKSLRPRIIKNIPYWSRDERNLNVDNFLDELGNNLSLYSQVCAEDN